MLCIYVILGGDVLKTFHNFGFFRKNWRGQILELLPYMTFVPVSDILLQNIKIRMKLIVKYNLLKYAKNEKKSQTENRK